MQKIHIFSMRHMKGNEANITFHQETTLLYYVIHAITLKCFHIVTHSYTDSLSVKSRFYETNNIFLFQKLNRSTQKRKLF